ncbi:hypothetical protein [Pelomonas sp. SE-A7]|uniref:hypothetical protein n=1 Tax=Pelomonas sp. SE-A7 TaxID=3054953 RepID=UPI00259CED6A|nr:hypothetical protein [Pelomonas sp. SE-A7]MDM4768216.1 hypothetical protein [Pelomonas sp. SE-A7]
MPWKSTAAGQLQIRHWAESWLVFHPPSGSVHLLDELVGQVLSELDRLPEPADTDRLARLLLDGEEPEPQDQATVLEVMEVLKGLRLVDEVPV